MDKENEISSGWLVFAAATIIIIVFVVQEYIEIKDRLTTLETVVTAHCSVKP